MILSKNQSLQVKGAAVMLLLFHHLFSASWVNTYNVDSLIFPRETLLDVAYAGRVCVWVFAFISAYGITVLFMQKEQDVSLLRFTYKRWLPLMSAFWFIYPLVFILYVILGRTPFSSIYQNNFLFVLADFFGLSNLFGLPTLTGVWWYICFAQLSLIVLPVLICICRKIEWLALPFFFLLVQYVPQDVGIASRPSGNYLQYVPVMIIAVLCAVQGQKRASENTERSERTLVKVIVALVLFFAFSVLRYFTAQSDFAYKSFRLPWFLFSLAAWMFVYCVSRISAKGVVRVLAFFGKHSGNMFFIHIFFVVLAGEYVYISGNVFLTWLTLFAVSLLTSVLIEGAKHLLRYDRLVAFLKNKQGVSTK